MPNGKIHMRASIGCAILAFVIFYVNRIANFMYSAYIGCGALLGVLVSPDLDIIEKGNYSLVIIGLRSQTLAKLWWLFWWPYAKLHHHRGISHWPIVGTLGRVIYIAIPIIMATIILDLYGIRVSLYMPWLAPVIFGLMLADFVHTILDVFVKGKSHARS